MAEISPVTRIESLAEIWRDYWELASTAENGPSEAATIGRKLISYSTGGFLASAFDCKTKGITHVIHCCDDHELNDFEDEILIKTKGLRLMHVKLPKTSSFLRKPETTPKDPMSRKNELDLQDSVFGYETIINFISSAAGKVAVLSAGAGTRRQTVAMMYLMIEEKKSLQDALLDLAACVRMCIAAPYFAALTSLSLHLAASKKQDFVWEIAPPKPAPIVAQSPAPMQSPMPSATMSRTMSGQQLPPSTPSQISPRKHSASPGPQFPIVQPVVSTDYVYNPQTLPRTMSTPSGLRKTGSSNSLQQQVQQHQQWQVPSPRTQPSAPATYTAKVTTADDSLSVSKTTRFASPAPIVHQYQTSPALSHSSGTTSSSGSGGKIMSPMPDTMRARRPGETMAYQPPVQFVGK